MMDSPRVSHCGTGAVLFEAPGPLALLVQARIWHVAALAARWPGVTEAVPGVTNLLLHYAAPPRSLAEAAEPLLRAWAESEGAAIPAGRAVTVPVRYGGAAGCDLQDVAERTGLTEAEVIRRHGAAEYRVFAIGSQPGFAYLGGLDPALAVPRRAVPRLRVAAGTVVIGGGQAAVVAAAGPNGWNAIGHTTLRMFDPSATPPATFQPADRVYFRADD